MTAITEGVLVLLLILGSLVMLFALFDMPRGLGLLFRFLLVGGWFWWIGWEALLGLVILELIGSGVLIVNPIADFLDKREESHPVSKP